MKALKSSFLTVCKSFDCNEKFSYKIILKKSRFLKIKKMKKNSFVFHAPEAVLTYDGIGFFTVPERAVFFNRPTLVCVRR